MRDRLLLLIFCVALGCGDVDGSRDAGLDDDGGVARDAAMDAAMREGCGADDLEACAFVPTERFDVGAMMTRQVSYEDVTGETRVVQVEIRRPRGATEPTPVVLWSHGGASGKRDATTVGTGWGEVFVRAGYTFVAIAHTPRDRAAFDALCVALDWTDGCGGDACVDASECSAGGESGICVDGGCRYWKHLSWDRPHDVRAVLDHLEVAASAGMPLEGSIDLSRVIYAGHSAGAGATMMVAGATRQIAGEDMLLLDPRPVAFLSASPQGPGDDGFTEASLTGEACRALATDPGLCLTRPHLTLTGVGDDTSDHVAENRRLSFDLAPSGDRHLLWIEEEAARHTTFEYGTEACERHVRDEGGDAARCEAYLVWLRSVAVAFAQAVARDDEVARAYLSSDDPERLAEGGASWEHR
ncbi:MAG: hypothetical protein EVA89_10275 [Sandaracinaceae bacterium]|nr:MAG: hypothetical protein EVA89_10275 [Sandaracinaceae bacterium]